MAPASVPRSKRGLGKRLAAKVGPLPVWGWAAAILAAYFLFSRMRPPAATTTADTAGASTSDGTTGEAQVPASGQGSPADNLNGSLIEAVGANTSAIDALTSQILSQPYPYSNFGDAPPAGDTGLGTGPASQPTVQQPGAQPAPHPAAVGGSAAHQTQTAAGVLKWGGLTFTTKAAFDSWARAHGSSTTAELRNHPQARSIYGTLK